MMTGYLRNFEYTPPDEPLRILYADEDILVISKPAGLLSVRGKPVDHWDCAELRAKKLYPTARVVHRLDMSTSGILIMALNPHAVRHLGAQFEQRKIDKVYIARVWGVPEQDGGIIDLPLICDWPNRPLQKVDYEVGKPSQTRWRILERREGTAKIYLEPLTGRSHQLRVHLMSLGYPILGDEFYAHEEAFLASPRLLLHAAKICFQHPVDGRHIEIDDPCPF